MKKIVSMIVMLIFITSLSFAEDSVTVVIPEFDITINDVKIDVAGSQYPMISYKGVTYIPMTSDYVSGLGLDSSWNSETGLNITKSVEAGLIKQTFLGASNVLGSQQEAQLVTFPVKVNGYYIDSKLEEYPLLLFRDITYFPMTWRFANDEFDWLTEWDVTTGFKLSILNRRPSKEVFALEDLKAHYLRSDYSTRNNPVRMNESIIYEDMYTENKLSKMTLKEVFRGKDAYNMIKDTSRSKIAPKGREFMVLKFEIEYLGGEDAPQSNTYDRFYFRSVNTKNWIIEETPHWLNANDSVDFQTFNVGDKKEVNVLLFVDEDEKKPLICFAANGVAETKLWFRAYESLEDESRFKRLNGKPVAKKAYMLEHDFGKRTNPVKLGDFIDDFKSPSEVDDRFTLLEVERGEHVYNKLRNLNSHIPLPSGFEYILIKMRVEGIDSTSLDYWDYVLPHDFYLLDKDGNPYHKKVLNTPSPTFNYNYFEGSIAEGYMAFMVKKSDKTPLLSKGTEESSWNPLYFEAFKSH